MKWVAVTALIAAAVVGVAITHRRGDGKAEAAAMLAGLPSAYSPAGRYVGPLHTNVAPPKIKLGSDGIPVVHYDGVGYRRNPVTAAQYGLWAYGAHKTKIVVRIADWLVAHQTRDGRWLYDFPFSFDGVKLKAPWASAMAQGQAMSLLERAYRLTGRRRYLTAATKALAPLRVSVKNGGLRACFLGDCRLPFYEEYPTSPHSYVLNGFMFTLVGMYDLASVAPRTDAHALYLAGRHTLAAALSDYDSHGRARYDLVSGRHADYRYQAIHVYLLRALNALKAEPVFAGYAVLWSKQFD